jgi:hypothetical protein
MATWKKVIVSGSGISQLSNDAGYIASVGGGIVSGSSAGTAQGQFKLNGVDVSAKDLSTTSNVTFAQVTGSLKGNVVGNVTGNLTGAVTGNADTATTAAALTTARAFTTTGDVVITSTNFDGSANFTADATIQAGSVENTMFAANAKTAISGAFTSTSASIAADIAALEAGQFDLGIAGDSGTGEITNAETLTFTGGTNITSVVSGNAVTHNLDSRISLTDVTASLKGNVVGNVTGNVTGNADTATTTTGTSTGQGLVTVGTNSNIDLGLQTSASPTFTNLVLTGNLTVQGTTTELQTTNLNVEDQFILINSGGAAADGGLVVNGAGAAIGWDETEKRFALDFEGATFGQTQIGTDAFVAAVVTTDDANYRKNGNIRVQSGDVFIYVE